MKIKTRVDGQCAKEASKKNIVFDFVVLGIAVFYAITDIIIATIKNNWNNVVVETTLVLSIVLSIGSSILLFKLFKAIKLTDERAFDAVYDFTEEFIIREVFYKGEKRSEDKISYSEIANYRVSKNYIFLVSLGKSYLPVSKDDELEALLISKGIFRK